MSVDANIYLYSMRMYTPVALGASGCLKGPYGWTGRTDKLNIDHTSVGLAHANPNKTA